MRFRPFENADPPLLAEIWRNHPNQTAYSHPMSPSVMEQFVFSKPYFDRDGFIVAESADQVVGFAHIGFGPTSDMTDVGHEIASLSMLMASPGDEQTEIAGELIGQAIEYARRKGAATLFAGGLPGIDPFYMGLYGGSRCPGVLESDTQLLSWYDAAGFTARSESVVFHRQLGGFRPLVDRMQMQIRRQYNVEALFDPPTNNWWEACTTGWMNVTEYQVVERGSGAAVGSLHFWDIEPLASTWGVHAMGILKCEIDPDHRQQGLGTFLLGESMRQLQSQRIALVEIQCPVDDDAGTALVKKLGFDEHDRARQLAFDLS